MPSTRRQKAKARRSREMDMMSDFDNLDVMIGMAISTQLKENYRAQLENHLFKLTLSLTYLRGKISPKKMSLGIRTMEIKFSLKIVFWNH